MASSNLKEFNAFYESKLKNKLFEIYYDEKQSKCIKAVIDRFKIMVDYNVPHGKKLRGMCAYESLLHLVGLDMNSQIYESKYLRERNYDPNKLIDEAKAIGWCIEFVCFDKKIMILKISTIILNNLNKATRILFSCRRYYG